MQTGGIINANRHAVRLREILSLKLMQLNDKRAAASHSRPATEALGLLLGDLVDMW